MYKQIYLKRGKEESLKRFHPWIFSGAIHHADEGIEEGEIVRVITSSGEFIAIGHYQIGSITVRVLSFQDTIIDDNFWHERLKEALYVRLAIGIADNPDNDTYRLVHGEGDGIGHRIVVHLIDPSRLIVSCLNDRMVEPTEPATEIERREHLSLERAILPVAAHKAVSRYLGIEAVLLRNGDGVGKSKLLSAYRHAMHDEGNNS